MKKSILLYILIVLCHISSGQEPQLYESIAPVEYSPRLFLGTGTGINNMNGFLGITLEGKIIDKFTLTGGLGIGMWGTKMGIGPRYYPKYPTGVYYTLSFTTASGFKGLELPMETDRAVTDTVRFNLNRANNVNISLGYQFKVFKRGRIHVEIGYAMRIERSPYEIVTPGVVLSDMSVQLMNAMVPGGIILGLGLSVGL
jgi:hypothetical protein